MLKVARVALWAGPEGAEGPQRFGGAPVPPQLGGWEQSQTIGCLYLRAQTAVPS